MNPVQESTIKDERFRRFERVLQMVHELHKVGYQGLRLCTQYHDGISYRIHIAPSVLLTHDARSNVMISVFDNDYPIAAAEPFNHRLALAAHYTTGDNDRYFGWQDGPGSNARNLANKFIERFPRLSELAFMEDWAYSGWLSRLIGEVEGGWTPLPSGEVEGRYYSCFIDDSVDDPSLIDGSDFMILLPHSVTDEEKARALETTPYDFFPHGKSTVRTFPLPPPVVIDNNALDRFIRTLLRWNVEDQSRTRDQTKDE